MDIAGAFDKTLKHCKLSAREVAERAGMDEGVVSKFRNRRQRIYTDTLEKLLDGLNDEAKIYFFSLLFGKKIDLEMIVADMDDATVSNLFLIAANKISSKQKKQTNKKKAQSGEKKSKFDDEENNKKVAVTGLQ